MEILAHPNLLKILIVVSSINLLFFTVILVNYIWPKIKSILSCLGEKYIDYMKNKSPKEIFTLLSDVQLKQACDFVAKFEGFRDKAYNDIGGFLTIGYGQRIGINDYPNGITKEQALKLLENQLHINNLALQQLVLVPINANQQIALLSLIYNIGTHAFSTSTLLKKINARASADEIRAQFLRWHYVQNKEVQGLLNRRIEEADLYNKPVK